MTEVYAARLAQEVGPGRILVIKILPTTPQDDPEAEARFLEEARIVLNLTHGNITAAFEFGRDEGRPFLVMEYVPGPSLHRLLDHLKKHGRRLQIQDALFISREICRALSYAHTFAVPGGGSRGLVHRDISPDNILISVSGHVKLTDFGIAQFSRSWHQGTLWGKAAYIAPEVITGEPPIPSSDIYSLGAVLYECLTGRTPFVGKNDAETLDLVRARAPEPPSALRKDCPEEVDTLVLKLLSKDQNERPSASSLVIQLTQLLANINGNYAEPSLAQAVSDYFSEDDYLTPASGQQIRAMVLEAGGQLRGEDTSEIITGKTVPLDDSVQSLGPSSSRKTRSNKGPVILTAAAAALVLIVLSALFLYSNRGHEILKEHPQITLPEQGRRGSALGSGGLSENRPVARPGEHNPASPISSQKVEQPSTGEPELQKNVPLTESNEKSDEKNREGSLKKHSGVKFGWVNINSYPWSYVTVDGKNLEGHTPHKRVKLKAGKHILLFENHGLGLKASKTIQVKAQEEISVGVRLEKTQ